MVGVSLILVLEAVGGFVLISALFLIVVLISKKNKKALAKVHV